MILTGYLEKQFEMGKKSVVTAGRAFLGDILCHKPEKSQK